MKKILCIFLALTMVFLFAACGGSEDAETTAENAAETTASADNAQTEEKDGLFSSFTAKSIDGKDIDENILKGKKVTMINIWATFCGPCINEMPDLQKLSEDYADKDFQIIGIVCDIQNDGGTLEELSIKEAKDILEQTGVKYLNLLPSESLQEIKLNEVYSIPETIFVDENGNVIGESFIGSKSYDQWADIIESALDEVE